MQAWTTQRLRLGILTASLALTARAAGGCASHHGHPTAPPPEYEDPAPSASTSAPTPTPTPTSTPRN
jgi:hypothetical protein